MNSDLSNETGKSSIGEAGILYDKFYNIIKILRNPGGCPWDQKQTPLSLLPNLIEEAYEVIDAVNQNDMSNAREELGDLLLLVSMISCIFEQDGQFTLGDVITGITEKIIRRHPHIFLEHQDLNPAEVNRQWEEIKRTQEGKPERKSVLDGIPKSLPPLEKSHKLQKKAARVGFDWIDVQPVIDKVKEELEELQRSMANGSRADAVDEMGDLLFSVVNLARFLELDPSICLHSTNNKFEKRFKYIESRFSREGRQMGKENMQLMDRYWEESKSLPEKDSPS
jgi:tetrapyrrole methylase family protein / MazG family protein